MPCMHVLYLCTVFVFRTTESGLRLPSNSLLPARPPIFSIVCSRSTLGSYKRIHNKAGMNQKDQCTERTL